MASYSTRSAAPEVNPSPPARAVVIGYGSPLRSDDAIGWRTAQELASTSQDPTVHFIQRHQLGPELAEICSQAELVVFIDAASGDTPGKISCVPVDAGNPDAAAAPLSCSHQLTPATLLTIAKTLYGRVPRAWLLSIVAQSFALGEELSPSLQAALPQLLDRARALLANNDASH
jgi:hydrogenase maturation protease